MHTQILSSLQDVYNLITRHETYRSQCINLIASENIASPAVRRLLSADLGGRYPTYLDDPRQRDYRGTRIIAEIEVAVQELAKQVYDAEYVDFRPLGGHLAGVGAICGLTQPGDIIFETGALGGHRTATKMVDANLLARALTVEYIPYDIDTHDIDMPALIARVREKRPRLIIFGRDQILFPENVQLISGVAAEVGAYIAYDFSHIHGLVAGKVFPNPLDQGAHVVLGSHHKTFPGPQGGLYMTRDEEIYSKVRRGLYPAFVGNHHVERVLALAVAYLEMREFGEVYATQIVRNSQALGKALQDRGIAVLYPERGFSQSHQVLVDVTAFGSGDGVAARLEQANIICGRTMIPKDILNANRTFSGLRLGTQEITRIGMVEENMDQVSALIERVLVKKESPARVADDVINFVSAFDKLMYCFDKTAQPFDVIWK
jgi:glycine hydroxymethyltransferase